MQTSFTEKQLQDKDNKTSETIIRKCVHCGMCNATCPTYGINGEEVEVTHPLKKIGISLGEEVTQAYASLGFTHACEAVLILVRTCNKYIDETAPWSLYKQGQLEALAEVLYSVLESVRLAAYLLSPIIPNISNAIYQQLGFSNDFNNKSVINSSETFVQQISWGALPVNQALGQPQPIFKRLELIETVT